MSCLFAYLRLPPLALFYMFRVTSSMAAVARTALVTMQWRHGALTEVETAKSEKAKSKESGQQGVARKTTKLMWDSKASV